MKNQGIKHSRVLTRLDIAGAARRSFEGDRPSFIIFLICALVFLAQSLMILIFWGKLPPQVPLFYSKPWGEAILAPAIALAILPITTIGSVATNYFLAIFLAANKQSFSANNKFLVRSLTIFSLLISFGMLYSCVKIITLLT